MFAEAGSDALKVEALARRVNKNKSSFYHYFGDLETFKLRLVDHHTARAKIIVEEERHCQSIDPDLIELLVKYEREVLFHRQLLINHHTPPYGESYATITTQGIDAILKIWNKELGIAAHSSLGRGLLRIGLENLFQRSSPQNITCQHLTNSFRELKTVALELRNSRALNGFV